MALAWSGIVNIGASSGHWAITDWFLHWAMRNTVRTQAALGGLTVTTPAADPRRLVSAAGHYAATCDICPGAPGERQSPVTQAATQSAPDLLATANEGPAETLYWIIKQGRQFTPIHPRPELAR